MQTRCLPIAPPPALRRSRSFYGRAALSRASGAACVAVALSGCVLPGASPGFRRSRADASATPRLQILSAPKPPPRRAKLDPLDEVISIYDLGEKLSLKVSLDPHTGRRTLEDAYNIVHLEPGSSRARINDREVSLPAPVLWRNGVLYAPTAAHPLLIGRLRRPPVPTIREENWGFIEAAPAAPARRAPTNARVPNVAVAGERRWKHIVIHHSATSVGGATSFHNSHKKKWSNGLGYHFVIGNGTETGKGVIEVGTRWKRQGQGIDGAHAGIKEYNKWGIGVCLVGDFQGGVPQPQQLEALRALCRTLMDRYGIPKSRVKKHQTVRPGHTACPGSRFPFKTFIDGL